MADHKKMALLLGMPSDAPMEHDKGDGEEGGSNKEQAISDLIDALGVDASKVDKAAMAIAMEAFVKACEEEDYKHEEE